MLFQLYLVAVLTHLCWHWLDIMDSHSLMPQCVRVSAALGSAATLELARPARRLRHDATMFFIFVVITILVTVANLRQISNWKISEFIHCRIRSHICVRNSFNKDYSTKLSRKTIRLLAFRGRNRHHNHSIICRCQSWSTYNRQQRLRFHCINIIIIICSSPWAHKH